MTATKWVILGVLVLFPFLWLQSLSMNNELLVRRNQRQFNTLIDNVMMDTTFAMKYFHETHFDFEAKKKIEINTDAVLEAFRYSYFTGFNVRSEHRKALLEQGVMALVLVGYDGYYLYSQGRMSPKLPYVKVYENIYYEFTLDQEGLWMDPVTLKSVEGNWLEMTSLPPGMTLDKIEALRNGTIVDTLEKSVNQSIAVHEKSASQEQVTRHLQLARVDSDFYGRAIEDIGVMAFFQGEALGFGERKIIAKLSSADVIHQTPYVGYEDSITGQLFYQKEKEYIGDETAIRQIFYSQEGAARAGFWPVID